MLLHCIRNGSRSLKVRKVREKNMQITAVLLHVVLELKYIFVLLLLYYCQSYFINNWSTTEVCFSLKYWEIGHSSCQTDSSKSKYSKCTRQQCVASKQYESALKILFQKNTEILFFYFKPLFTLANSTVAKKVFSKFLIFQTAYITHTVER